MSYWVVVVIIIIFLLFILAYHVWCYNKYYIKPITYEDFTGYDHRPNSYDLFDTLGCRRFGSDDANFAILGKRHNLPHFAHDRKKTSGKTLHDIYRKLEKMGYDKSLMHEEIALEIENIVPIAYHVNLVESGDNIISDTWYDKDTICEILRKLDVREDVVVHATPDGKHKKWIWPQVNGTVTHHLGDNPHTDGTAQQFGIVPIIHEMHKMTPIENQVASHYPLLAYCMRESRLLNPHQPGSDNYYLWLGQSQYNFPIMLMFCQYLDNWCQQNGIRKVCGMLRDACLFNRLFELLYHDKYEIRLMYISRKAMRRPTNYTLEYFKDHAAPGKSTVWIDGHGTGATFVDFMKKYDIDMPYNMNIFRYWSAQRKGKNYHRRMGNNFYRWLTTFKGRQDLIEHPKLVQMIDDFWGDMIEMFNCDVNGSFLNFTESGVPQFKQLEYPAEVAKAGHEAFDAICKMYMKHYYSIDDQNLNDNVRQQLVLDIHLNAENQDCFWELRRKYHDYT